MQTTNTAHTSLTNASLLFPDPTSAMEMVQDEDVSPLATRYVFLAGDLLDPTRKEQLEHLSRGGEETGNWCLRRTTAHFLPRCAITPLEYWGEDLPLSLFPKEGPDVRTPLRLRDVPVSDAPGRTSLTEPRFYYPHYPGELIRDITQQGNLDRVGIVELTALRGIEWSTGTAQAMQEALFPESWEVPVEISAIEARITEVQKGTKDKMLRSICTEALQGCELTRRYMQRRIDAENTLVAQRVSPVPGSTWVYRYSAQVHSFMKQLGQAPAASGVEAINSELLKALTNTQIPQQLDPAVVSKLGEVFGAALREAIASIKPE